MSSRFGPLNQGYKNKVESTRKQFEKFVGLEFYALPSQIFNDKNIGVDEKEKKVRIIDDGIISIIVPGTHGTVRILPVHSAVVNSNILLELAQEVRDRSIEGNDNTL